MVTIKPGETNQDAIIRHYKESSEDTSMIVAHFLKQSEVQRRITSSLSKVLSAGWRLPFGFRLVRIPKQME